MKDFTGKVSVVTGAASGIGYALAKRSAQEGMNVVLADIDEFALRSAAKNLEGSGVRVLPVTTDVSRNEDVEKLAEKTIEEFGKVNLLFNNAGVAAGVSGHVWEESIPDWQWGYQSICGV